MNDTVKESFIQNLVHEHPSCLPIIEIDPIFAAPEPICTELQTVAGPIDNFMVTTTGLPVLVECKLWKNPQGRREVVGQILDYAKELSRWSSSDLVREVRRRLKRDGNPLLEVVQAVDPTVDEIQFGDALTTNLRRGRFLLLVVGDGIREGVEAIAEYIQAHAGLHFTLGLVEMPIYIMPDGNRLVAPRVLARTTIITRTVVAVPDGYALQGDDESTDCLEIDSDRGAIGEACRLFWQEFVEDLNLDDPAQSMAKPARVGHMRYYLPVRSSWLSVYRNMRRGEMGVVLQSSRNTPGAFAMQQMVDDWDDVKRELGGTAHLGNVDDGRHTIIESRAFGDLGKAEVRKVAFAWLGERINTYVNALRPRMRSAAVEFQSQDE